MTARIIRCKYNDCTAEAVDEVGELLLCTKHLAWAYQLLTRKGVAFRAELVKSS